MKPACLEWLGDEATGRFCLRPPAGVKVSPHGPLLIFVCEDHGPYFPLGYS